MGGHGPATDWGVDNAAGYKTKLGIVMFVIYAVIYGAFILINVMNPKIMGADVGNITLAMAYGFALIVGAVIMALIYNKLCTQKEKEVNH